MKIIGFIWAAFLFCPGTVWAQQPDTSAFLMADARVQLESVEAMNDLYDFRFAQAEQQFRWLYQKYRWHPLPHFLLGVSQWWKMMPYAHDNGFGERFLAHMDTSIMVARNLYENHPAYKLEAAFFLAASHGFKGYYYSDDLKKNWAKAVGQGKAAVKYMNECSGQNYLSPELLFGDALYNYFAEWIPENYAALKPVLWFFKKGDKQLGLKQLEEVSNNAFYTRVEAMIWDMRIQTSYERNQKKAMRIAEYLHDQFPNNPYFHRYYLRVLYSRGMYSKLVPSALQMLERIDSTRYGYEANSGRYAAFYLGHVYKVRQQLDKAKKYYLLTVDFAQQNNAVAAGYYHYALLGLGDISAKQGDRKKAAEYFKLVKKQAKRKNKPFKEAKKRLRNLKKEPRSP